MFPLRDTVREFCVDFSVGRCVSLGRLICFYLSHDDNFITYISHFILSGRGLGTEFMVHLLILLQKCIYLFLSSYSLAFL